MIFNSSGTKQYKSQLWDFDFQSSIWNKNQMDENHTDQVSLTIGLKTWKKKEKKNPLSQSSLYGPGNKVARLWRHVRCLIPAFGQMDFRVPSSKLRAPSSKFRFPSSDFCFRQSENTCHQFLIHEIQKTDWPQSFLIKLNWDWDQWF